MTAFVLKLPVAHRPEIYAAFRRELLASLKLDSPAKLGNPRSTVLACLLLKAFIVLALEVEEGLETYFGDLIPALLQFRSTTSTTFLEVERLLSTVCQKNNLPADVINKIKASYGESYFSLMDISFSDYPEKTFRPRDEATPGDRILTYWMTGENLHSQLIPLPLYPDLSSDEITVKFGDHIRQSL